MVKTERQIYKDGSVYVQHFETVIVVIENLPWQS